MWAGWLAPKPCRSPRQHLNSERLPRGYRSGYWRRCKPGALLVFEASYTPLGWLGTELVPLASDKLESLIQLRTCVQSTDLAECVIQVKHQRGHNLHLV